jgi:hypothetical protein
MGFDPGMDTSWWPLVLADAGGGKILVGGNVTDAGGNPAERLVRLNANGNLDSGFNVGAGADATILAIAMQPNGDFIIGGDFKSYDNVSRVRIARIFGGSEPDNDPPLPDVDPLPDVLAECSVGFGDLVIPTATDEVDGTIYGKTDESIFPITQQGSHTITWTYTDSSGNSASQDQLIVIHDDVPPVVLTRDITVELDAGGEAVITAAMVDDGTYDNCGIASLELDKTVFTADDLGENIVTLTATDVNGNQASATAVVTVTEVAPKLYVSVAYTGSTFVQAQAHNAQTVDVSLSADLWVSSVNVPGDGRTMTLVFELYDVADPDNSLVEVVGPVEVVHWNISGGSASTQVVVAHTLSISDADARTYEVVAVAGGDYAGSSVRGEIMLTVFKPLRLHVAAGGKTMVYPTYMNGMLYPGEDFSNVAFGAFVRFNNNGNNPRGHAAVSWQQMDRKLVAQAGIVESLAVDVSDPGNKVALLKASGPLVELLPDGSKQTVISNVMVEMRMRHTSSMYDPHYIALSVWEGAQLVFSSYWDGTETQEQSFQIGGVSIESNRSFGSTKDSGNTSLEVTESSSDNAASAGVRPSVTNPDSGVSAVNDPLINQDPSVSAYPNPFREQINFRFMPENDGGARIELFDISGARIAVVFDEYVSEGQVYEVVYRPQIHNTSVVFYRIIIGNRVSNGKLIYKE